LTLETKSLSKRDSLIGDRPDMDEKSPGVKNLYTKIEPKTKKKTKSIDELDELKGTVQMLFTERTLGGSSGSKHTMIA